MTTQQLSVACLGLGRIGSGIAQSVQRAGYHLVVYNRTIEKAQRFSSSGAVIARSPREAAKQADIVLTCLMGDESVLENLVGDDGILSGLSPGAIHIGTSTVTPKATAQFAKIHSDHGSHYLASTFAGHPDHAATGKLMTFVAGDPAILERARSVLESYSAQILVLGDKPALAASFKLVVNFFASCLLESMGEAFVFAEKQGVKLETVASMMKDILQHPAMGRYVDKIYARSFSQVLGSTLDGAGSKDIRYIAETAADFRVPLPFASVVRDKITAAQACGFGEHDWSVFTEIARLNAGLTEPMEKARTV